MIDFDSLSLKPGSKFKPYKKTGIVYHLDMLLHRCDENDELAKKHVENPFRLSSILERLGKSEVLKKCVVFTDLKEIDMELVKNIHGEFYADYIE